MNRELSDTPHILMCPPTYYKISDPDPVYGHPNDMSDKAHGIYIKDPALFQKKAQEQWDDLYKILTEKVGIQVTLLDPNPTLADQVFTADASLSLQAGSQTVTILSKFSHWGRHGEVDPHQNSIQQVDPSRQFVRGVFASEGTGDNVYDTYRDCFWSGYNTHLDPQNIANGRSDKRAHDMLKTVLDIPVISLETKRPYFHIDTTFAPLSNGHIVAYPGGMTEEGWNTLLKTGLKKFDLNPEDYLIEVTQEEAEKFACNMIQIGDTLILPDCGDRLSTLLETKGYTVYTIDLSAFIAAGGGPHCLTNQITLKRSQKSLQKTG